ncbi:hypothetical protein [Paenisporosarcina sp. TG20]|uniref:hypothetical protein n=1 Tax=Paenisporosarcina sp. TG20 TaxID=1211706 RepID=UPI0002E997DF|nr:hypothetical protein [Paenisporosarcina sp. TG20]
MAKLVGVRATVNREKRYMLKNGTSYRKSTAVLASRLLNRLVSSNQSDLTQQELVRLVKKNYHVNDERANDVAKNVYVHIKSANDRVRLAKYYQRADELMNYNKDL